MGYVITGVVCLLIGSFVGFTTMALCAASRAAEERDTGDSCSGCFGASFGDCGDCPHNEEGG